MYKVGNTYTDTESGRTYECQSVITVSPTLITGKAGTYTTYSDITMDSIKETPGNTVVLVDEDGNEVVAVLVDEEVDFTATPDDIREGMVAATDDGVTVGEKFIPSYHTTEGTKVVMPGKNFSIPLPDYGLYDYTELQSSICPFKSSVKKSVSCEKVVIEDKVYEVLTTESLSDVQRNSDSKAIELGLTNETSSPYLMRYITFKEV